MLIQNFKYEFECMTKFNHPNLVEVYDFGRIDGTWDHFFTSEYVVGQNLFQIIKNLNTFKLFDIIVQICRALIFIHRRGFIHFDLKPENILLNSNKKVKLFLIILSYLFIEPFFYKNGCDRPWRRISGHTGYIRIWANMRKWILNGNLKGF